MKMTPRLWRILSVWISIAAVNCCYVAGNDLHQEAQKSAPSQDFNLEEVSGEDTPSGHHKVDESWVLPTQPLSGQELLEDNHPKDEQKTQDEVEPHSEDYKAKARNVDVAENEISLTDPCTEPSLINPEPKALVDQELDSTAVLPSSEPFTVSSAELRENPPTDTPNSVVEDASHVAASEVLESNLPPPDCEEGQEEEEIDNPYDSESPPPPTILENTSNAHTGGTKTLTDPPLTPPSVTPNTQPTEHTRNEEEQSSSVTTDTDSPVSSKDPEDIPTFDEWKRKMMEVEKEKTVSALTSVNGGSPALKKAQKNLNNYASVECGAKILGANPEAKSTSAVLKENMDLYMLNPCSHKIWFIVELCEPIQLKQLDIANFELFSSTPKDFLVSVSDRYPTNKWLKLGTFHARDERTVQSFPLDEHLYAKYVKMFTKYIKVELLSHFGSEHFCPLSLIRVFGTSMVEEYEQITDPSERTDDQDDELDYPGCAPGEVKLSKNLIGSAKDVILNMVNNIAANVLGGGPDVQANASSRAENLSEPSAKLETMTQKVTTDITPGSESEVEELLPDPGISETAAPSSEPSASETSDTNPDKQPLPPVEDQKVSSSDRDEEKPISSTIILLDKEEEEEESDVRKEKLDHKTQQENLQNPCCPPSSQCSFAASMKEYLTRQCSALQSKKRICQTAGRKQMFPTVKPSWHDGEGQQLDGKEKSAEWQQQQPENEASTSEATPALGNVVESHKEPVSEALIVLEPSQTPSFFQTSTTDSSATNPTSSMETPVLPSGEVTKEQRSEPCQDIPTTDKPSAASVSSSSSVSPSVEIAEAKPTADAPGLDLSTSVQISESLKTVQTQTLLPSTSLPSDHQHDPPHVPTTSTAPIEDSHPAPDTVVELETSSGQLVITESKAEDLVEDMPTPSGVGTAPAHHPTSPLPPSPSLSDIYAETANVTEQNGNTVHGSSQKESVFMRLNNRIKALEINMSLSGRYLEQLSQRYRKQMEEMQKAFNKTIIKLQNTSRIAEEQDLRQTEHIQLLQGQLHNMTQLVLNLSVRVSQLQSEVSGSQNYLLLSLLLCLGLGLLLCTSHCHISTVPSDTEVELTTCKNYTHCGSESRSTSCKDTGLKKSASYPLIHSDSLQLITPEGSEMLRTQSLCPANRKKRRRKLKPVDQVETLKPSLLAASELNMGALVCNGAPVTTNPAPFIKTLLQPVFRDSLSEAGSEGSSHSDDPSFCGIATACPQICDSLPLPKSRSEKRALRRRRPKPSCAVVDLLQAPKRDRGEPIPTIEETENKKTEKYPGAFGVNVLLSGPV